jgi:hypothetical protein
VIQWGSAEVRRLRTADVKYYFANRLEATELDISSLLYKQGAGFIAPKDDYCDLRFYKLIFGISRAGVINSRSADVFCVI